MSSKATRIAISVAPAAAIFAAFTYTMHRKDSTPAVTTQAKSTEASAPTPLSALVDKRHEALALESQLQNVTGRNFFPRSEQVFSD